MRTITKLHVATELESIFSGKITKKIFVKIIDAFWLEVIKQIKDGNRVTFREYGSFFPVWKAVRPNARSPRTGKLVLSDTKRLKTKFVSGRLLRVVQNTEISSDVCAGCKNESLNDSRSDKNEKVS